MRKLPAWKHLFYQLALLALALFVLVPVWGVVYLAFDSGLSGRPTSFRLWPEVFSFEVFVRMWVKPAQSLSFLSLLGNSLTVAGGAAVASVLLGASMAYAFARFRFPGRQTGLFALLVGALLPPVALMTPLYILLTALKIRTTLFGLMIVYAAFAMPFCIWNMRAAFQSVPRELEESAFLDGANNWIAYWRITLPLALPSIVVAALIAFLLGYTEFAMGWLFVEQSRNVTLAMALTGLLSPDNINASWPSLAALAIMMSLPVVVIFLVVQRSLLSGLLGSAAEE
jgi:arabinogalactan oligomer/maltooligosaccharide transport system permease protein